MLRTQGNLNRQSSGYLPGGRSAGRRSCRLEPLEERVLLSVYYVSPAGSDTGDGTASAPFQTLQHAANLVTAGDTVIAGAGTYAGFSLGWDFPQSGTASAPIVFEADPAAAAGSVVINARNPNTADGIDLEGSSYVVVQGFSVQNSTGTITRAGIRSVGVGPASHAMNVTIQNNVCDRNGQWGIFTAFSDNSLIQNNTTSRSQAQHGIYVSNSSVAPVIRGNQVWGNYASGIQLNGDASQGGSGLIVGTLVENNAIHDNGAGGGAAINCDGVQNSRFQNNLLYNNHAGGVALFKIDGAAGSKNNVVVNNTIVMPTDGRWDININSRSTGNTLFNNVLYNYNVSGGSITITKDSLAGLVSDHNAVVNRFSADGRKLLTLSQWQAKTGQDGNSFLAIPAQLFVNPAANDYHLLSTSPAVDSGAISLNGFSAPLYDLDGNSRPQGSAFDVGCFEYV